MPKTFRLIPAIDLMDGQCVRLKQGRSDQKSVYSSNPPEMARSFEMSGASRIHVVDLDGAFQGKPANIEAIRAIRERVDAELEVGGGLRQRADVDRLFDMGVNYAIIGTQAVEDARFVQELLEKYGEKIIIGVDARDGKVAIRGWVESGELDATTLARRLEDMGVQTVIYTDISTDGALTGPNLEAVEALAGQVGMRIIASGGVAEVEHILQLASLPCENVIGVICGRAIYEGKIQLPEAFARLQAGGRA